MAFFRVLGFIILAALAIGLGGAIFQSGYLAGVAADGGAPVVVNPAYGPGWGWGFGGGFFSILWTILFVLLFFGILSAIFGGGRRGWGHGGRGRWEHGDWDKGEHHRFGPWEDRAREAHDEWHRQAGSAGPNATGANQGATQPGPSGNTDPRSPGAG
jgi:hypothetical protein